MRLHPATRFLTLLMAVLLLGALAVPADGKRKRPRRYDVMVLEDWRICPNGATLTIAKFDDSVDDLGNPSPSLPDPQDDDLAHLSFLLESPSSLPSPLFKQDQIRIPDVDDEIAVVSDIPAVVSGSPLPDPVIDDEPEGFPGTITHREPNLRVTWSQLEVGAIIRLGLKQSGSDNDFAYGRFAVESWVEDCPPLPPPPGDGETGGGETGGSSPGVTTGSSVSTEEIQDLSAGIDENRQVGRGRDGSLVPRPQCTIVGTPGKDRIEGTPGHDVICGLGGKDVIDGDRGIDLIDGADGNDALRGGPGNDLHLLGLGGDDRLDGNGGGDRASGGAGIDWVRGSSGNDPLLSGGSGADRLSGGQGRDRIRGGSGRDRIGARDRTRDRVDGGSGWDRARVDRVSGAAGTRRQADRVRRVEQLL
jgi:Ca2+-binding RTX toxin-like protein